MIKGSSVKTKMGKIKQFIKNRIENWELYHYPLVISYPRSGAHWINSMMELYFDRPRLRRGSASFINENRKDWMWMADHDLYLKVLKKFRKSRSPRKILFLYRNPTDVIFSHLDFKHKEFDSYGYLFGEKFKDKEYVFSKEPILQEIKDCINHYKQYTENHGNIEMTIIKYENFVNEETYLSEFKKISDHFDIPFDENKVKDLFEIYGDVNFTRSKETVVGEYQKEKEDFMKKWKTFIEEEIKRNA